MNIFAALFIGFVALIAADISGCRSEQGRDVSALLSGMFALMLMAVAVATAATGVTIR